MKRKMKRPRLDVNLGELDKVLDQAREAPMSEPDCNKIKTALHALAELVEARRRQTEKTKAVVGEAAEKKSEEKPEEQPKGHGRKPAAAYEGAVKVAVPHAELNSGDACPECPKGKV